MPSERVRAERLLAGRLAPVETDPRLEPLPALVDQADQGHRRAAEVGGERGEIVEQRFGGGVQDAVGVQHGQSGGLVVGRPREPDGGTVAARHQDRPSATGDPPSGVSTRSASADRR